MNLFFSLDIYWNFPFLIHKRKNKVKKKIIIILILIYFWNEVDERQTNSTDLKSVDRIELCKSILPMQRAEVISARQDLSTQNAYFI